MPNSNVTRVVDANTVHLENEIPFNGSFRLFVYAGSSTSPRQGQHPLLSSLSDNLLHTGSFYQRFMHKNQEELDTHHDSNNPHSPFFSVALTLCAKRPDIEIEELPELFQAYRDRVYADDIPAMQVLNAEHASHAKVGLVPDDKGDQAEAAIVVVRPDGHLGVAVKLTEGPETVQALEAYFEQFLVRGEWDGRDPTSRPREQNVSRLGGGAAHVKSLL